MLTLRDPIGWKTEESSTLLTSYQHVATDKAKSPKTDRYTMQLTQVESKQKHNVWIEMLTFHGMNAPNEQKGSIFENIKRDEDRGKVFSLLSCSVGLTSERKRGALIYLIWNDITLMSFQKLIGTARLQMLMWAQSSNPTLQGTFLLAPDSKSLEKFPLLFGALPLVQ